MNNVILSMLAKISMMDAEAKLLAARVEAQSLIMSALVLTIGQNGGLAELISSVNKAINSIVTDPEETYKPEAELLLKEFNEIIKVSQSIANENSFLNSGKSGPFEAKA
ncbi:anti-adapter protein IraP [Pantoea osteomyelitidis]|uniref:Anti-adapter protein IraP n=1 Tax=Pantoea osteomyelitidis TaxID=3230026 RepID=A0ABW7PVR8_9GAMM